MTIIVTPLGGITTSPTTSGVTCLSLVQDVCVELGLPTLTSISTTDQTTVQVLALMNRLGNTLVTEREWQVLSAEHRFITSFYEVTGDTLEGSYALTNLSSVTELSTDFMVTGSGVQQDTFVTSVGTNSVTLNQPALTTATGVTFTFGQVKYPMPADFDRIINKTMYNKSNRWAIVGPKDAQEWQWLKSSYITAGPRMRFRIINNKFTLWPIPNANLTMGFEYVSNSWVVAADGTGKSKFTNDTDVSLFPAALLILGTKLKFYEAKGFDTSNLRNDYIRELDKYKATEAAADTLSLSPRQNSMLLTMNNLPDSGYGG